MKKKIIILGIAISLVALVVAYFVFLKKQTPSQTTENKPPEPQITSYFTNEFPIELQANEKGLKIPETLPLLIVDPFVLSAQQIKKIGTNFNFSQEAKTSNDVFEGATYTWSDNLSSLIVYNKSKRAIYTLNDKPQVINKQLSDLEIATAAKTFLESKFGVSTQLDFYSIKKEPGFFDVQLLPASINYKILTLNPDISIYHVFILPDGTIFSAQLFLVGKIRDGETLYKIKGFPAIKAGLPKAKIVSIDNGKINLPDVPDQDIRKITVDTIEIAYLLDNASAAFLQPVFLLNGLISVSGYPNTMPVSLYLPALE